MLLRCASQEDEDIVSATSTLEGILNQPDLVTTIRLPEYTDHIEPVVNTLTPELPKVLMGSPRHPLLLGLGNRSFRRARRIGRRVFTSTKVRTGPSQPIKSTSPSADRVRRLRATIVYPSRRRYQ